MARRHIHPCEILRDELDQVGISASALTRQIGRRAITSDTALRLDRWFGTSAELWMNLQQTFELDLARQQVGGAIDRLPARSPQPPSSGMGQMT